MKCRICYSSAHKLLFHIPSNRLYEDKGIDSLQILQCLNCGLVFSGLDLDDQSARDLYNQDYFESDGSVRAVDRVVTCASYESALDKLNQFGIKTGKLLDVGCGYGDFLRSAQSRGWDVGGLDISSWAAKAATQRVQQSGALVSVGTLERTGYPSKTFDVVTAWDLIEHVSEPQAFVAEAGRILKPGGILVIRTPNQDSLFHWLAGIAARIGWSYPSQQIYHVDHLTYFTKSALTSLLTLEDFVVQLIEYEDLTIYDERFQGWNRAIISIVHWLAKALKKHHAMIVFAVYEP